MRIGAINLKGLAGLAGLFIGGVSAGAVWARDCTLRAAQYQDLSAAYGHGAVKDGEWAHLRLTPRCKPIGRHDEVLTPPAGAVFEGPAPMVTPGGDYIFAVESSLESGSRVLRYGRQQGAYIAGPWIGAQNRWLSLVAPVRVGNAAGFGVLVIDRPHLKGDLQLLSEVDGQLVPRVIYQGVTNHRRGAANTVGGARLCDGEVSFVFATLDWASVVRINVDTAAGTAHEAARFSGVSDADFDRAMACE